MTKQILSEDIRQVLEKPSTQIFLKTARQFIDLIEKKEVNKDNFYPKSHSLLIELYSPGYNLDSIKLKYSHTKSDFKEVKVDNLNVLKIDLTDTLGQDSFYWEVFDPTYKEKDGKPMAGFQIGDKEPLQGWLVDDYTDIYRDLKTEIMKIDTIGSDEAVEDALWQLKFGFYNHWGNHCVNALRALHYLYYNKKQTT